MRERVVPDTATTEPPGKSVCVPITYADAEFAVIVVVPIVNWAGEGPVMLITVVEGCGRTEDVVSTRVTVCVPLVCRASTVEDVPEPSVTGELETKVWPDTMCCEVGVTVTMLLLIMTRAGITVVTRNTEDAGAMVLLGMVMRGWLAEVKADTARLLTGRSIEPDEPPAAIDFTGRTEGVTDAAVIVADRGFDDWRTFDGSVV